MKTKNNLKPLTLLAAIIMAPVLGGCPDSPFEETPFISQEGMKITLGKFTFTNEFDPEALVFTFCDNDGDCATPAENKDEIVLLPEHTYECTFECSGNHLQYANLKICLSTTSDLYLSINKCNKDNQSVEGAVTEWTTGNQSSGEVILSITDQVKSYIITMPVKIIQTADLD